MIVCKQSTNSLNPLLRAAVHKALHDGNREEAPEIWSSLAPLLYTIFGLNGSREVANLEAVLCTLVKTLQH